MLVDWGVDYLKYDNCFPRMVFKFLLESIILNMILNMITPSHMWYSNTFSHVLPQA